MKLIFPTWKECRLPGYVGLLCYHFDNKQYWTCWFLQCCFFFVERKLECTKIHDLLEMVAECYAAPHFWVQKKVWPPPHLHQPNPSNNWPVPKHSTSAPLFKLPVNFRILRWCRERSWSPRITFIWKTSEVSCYYSLCFICKIKLWNLMLVVILCKLNTWPNCHVSFIWMQSLSNAFLVCMIKNQFQGSSQLFYVTL